MLRAGRILEILFSFIKYFKREEAFSMRNLGNSRQASFACCSREIASFAE